MEKVINASWGGNFLVVRAESPAGNGLYSIYSLCADVIVGVLEYYFFTVCQVITNS